MEICAIGFESACLINSDSPTVPAARLRSRADLNAPGDRIGWDPLTTVLLPDWLEKIA